MENLSELQNETHKRMVKNKTGFMEVQAQSLTPAYIETRLENLERQWAFFTEIHNKVINSINREEYINSDYYKNDFYDKTEELYLNFKTALKEKLSLINYANNTSQSYVSEKTSEITIPQFSGKYTEWKNFKDTFKKYVHKNDSFNNTQKLQYLKGSLVDEPALILNSIPMVGEYYEVCWDLLKDRYDNRWHHVSSILKKLTGQKKSGVESLQHIRKLYNTMNECMKELNDVGVDTSTWDPLVIHLICCKLDQTTRCRWEMKVSCDLAKEVPTLEQFNSFLSERVKTLSD